MDFIFMLTRNDRTVEDAAYLIDSACDLGVRHIGFKDVGVPFATMQELAGTIRRRGGICYLEVVSTTSEAMLRSLEAGRALGVDRILGGTDFGAAQNILGDLSRYFPFPGNPVGHPTRLGGSAALVAEPLPACARFRVWRRGSPRLPSDRGGPARPRQGGARSAPGKATDRRRQREFDGTYPRARRGRRRCLHDRIGGLGWRVLARQGIIPRAKSRTFSRLATKLPRWRHEPEGPPQGRIPERAARR